MQNFWHSCLSPHQCTEASVERDTGRSALTSGDESIDPGRCRVRETVVAMLGLYAAAMDGYQGAMMAPTEVLARQHFAEAVGLLEPFGIRCAFYPAL